MGRVITLLTAVMLCMALAGCGGKAESPNMRGYKGKSRYKLQQVRVDSVLYLFKLDTVTCTIVGVMRDKDGSEYPSPETDSISGE